VHSSYMHIRQQVLVIIFKAFIPFRLHNRTELGCGMTVDILPHLAISQLETLVNNYFIFILNTHTIHLQFKIQGNKNSSFVLGCNHIFLD